jgi:hypothetical protein
MINKEFFIQTWQNEMQTTLNAIKGLPANKSKWDYKCNEKSRSAAGIIGHMLFYKLSFLALIKITHKAKRARL